MMGEKQKKQKTTKDIRNAAAGAQQKTKARKGNNGVLLKQYESVMLGMFSTKPSSTLSSKYEICQEALHNLTPRYSKLPSFIYDTDKQKLVDNAEKYWKCRGLTPSVVCNNDSPWPFDKETSLPHCGCVRETSNNTTRDVGDLKDMKRAWRKETQLANLIQCILTLIPDDILQNEKANKKKTFRIIDFAGKSALVLFYDMNSCVQYNVSAID